MKQNNNPFDMTKSDLGDPTSGVDLLGVDQKFSTAGLSTGINCLICTNTAKFKIIPKHSHLDTAEITDRGYICGHCMTQGYISPDDYGLREL